MKTSFKPIPADNGLHIPQEFTDKTGLKDAADVDLLCNEGFLLLLDSGLTPMQMAEALQMFDAATRNLITRLELAARKVEKECVQIVHGPDHVHIIFPNSLLAIAGFSPYANLEVEMCNGEIYISEETESAAGEDDDPLDHVPEYLIKHLAGRGLDLDVLARLFEREEKFYE